jgi:hypothetical protein
LASETPALLTSTLCPSWSSNLGDQLSWVPPEP